MSKPILGISMGDPFGSGPEITVKALADKTVYDRCRPLVVGDVPVMEDAAKVAKKVSGIDVKINPVKDVKDAKFEFGTIDVYDMGIVKASDIPGNPDDPKPFNVGPTKLGGEAAYQYVVKVIRMALNHEVDATITNAISKEAINMAGHHYSGHTEIYADETKTKKYAMMLAHENLRVIHVSTHVSLREACDRVKKERVLDCIHSVMTPARLSVSTIPKSAWQVLILIAEKTECSVVRKLTKFSRPLMKLSRKVSTFPTKSPLPPILCSARHSEAGMTSLL